MSELLPPTELAERLAGGLLSFPVTHFDADLAFDEDAYRDQLELPALALPSTDGPVDLREAAAGTLVLYIYPRTGRPGEPPPDGWDATPGARGCTPQSCAFRDHQAELAALGATVVGMSAQPLAAQVLVEQAHRRLAWVPFDFNLPCLRR